MRTTIILVSLLGLATEASAQNCAGTTTGLIPINDLGTGLYLGQFEGGLYPGGANQIPLAHRTEGLARAAAIVPRNAAGEPDDDGKYVLLSIGMSNTTQEFCSQPATEPCDPWTFMGRAMARYDTNREHLVIVNGARGSQAADTWDNPDDANYTRVRDQVLAPRGLTEAQVQVVWMKNAIPGPNVSLPSASADAYQLVTLLGTTMRTLKLRYPNLQMVFLSSRIYAGYATSGLNPEPYAYESGFAVKWLIGAQISQMESGAVDPRSGDLDFNTVAPWIAWGPYMWADGLSPRSDGLTWRCTDFSSDATHPAPGADGARAKVGGQLMQFFYSSPLCTPWMVDPDATCDADFDGNGVRAVPDLFQFLGAWFAGDARADVDGIPGLSVPDIFAFLSVWFADC